MPDISELRRRYKRMRSDRSVWDHTLQEVADYFLPQKGDFTVTWERGSEKNNRKLLDMTTVYATQQCASFLQGLIIAPNTRWIMLKHSGIKGVATVGSQFEDAVEEHLEQAVDIMLETLHASGTSFDSAAYECLQDVCSLGTLCMFVEEDDESFFVFRSYPISQVWWTELSNGEKSCVATVTERTASEIVQEWPDTASQQCRETAKNNPDKKINVVHMVKRREDYRDAPDATGKEMKWASYFFEEAQGGLLSEGGYRQNPYIIARWSKVSGEIIGRGPGLMALPSARRLMAMAYTMSLASEKLADQPLAVPDEDTLDGLRTDAGAINYYRQIAGGNGSGIEPLPVSADLRYAFEMFTRAEGQIREAFMAQQIEQGESPQMTATQVLAIQRQRYTTLAPVLARLQSELLDPLVQRVYQILLRREVIPAPPDEIADSIVSVQFHSPISRSQRAGDAEGLNNAIMLLGPLAQADPSIMDNFDLDEIARDQQEIFGFPQRYLKSTDEVEAMRDARRQTAQQQQELAVAQEAVNTAASARQKGLL